MTNPIQYVKQFATLLREGDFKENFLDNYIQFYGNTFNTGIVGKTIRKHVPELADTTLFRLEPFSFHRGNQLNFVLLSIQRQRRNNKKGPKTLYLNVFIGLTDDYPRNFIQDTGIDIDIRRVVQQQLNFRSMDSEDEDNEDAVRQDIYNKYLGPQRTERFYHVLVFKLNLERFGRQEYEMLWDLASTQHNMELRYPYNIDIDDVTSIIENMPANTTTVNAKENNPDAKAHAAAWAMSQHTRLGSQSYARRLPEHLVHVIAKEAEIDAAAGLQTPTLPKRKMEPWEENKTAWAMSQHTRLGSQSHANSLPEHLTRMIAQQAEIPGSEIGRPVLGGISRRMERPIEPHFPLPPNPFPQDIPRYQHTM